jgi:hypothetical protein
MDPAAGFPKHFHSMVNNKKQDKAQLKFIDELLKRPENQNCADCKVRGKSAIPNFDLMAYLTYRTSVGIYKYRLFPLYQMRWHSSKAWNPYFKNQIYKS